MPAIGSIQLDVPFYQAGLAGYSDAAMRLVARRHGCPYCVTEAMLDQFLIAGGKGLKAAELDAADHPIAGQLMGSHPRDIAAGAKVLLGLGYDVIDINLACPVKKIRKKCRGGHLLSAPDEAIAILDAVRQAVGDAAPCTVKLRRGSDDSPEAEANFFRIFEAVIELGYAGATVHGRTVQQKYLGPSRWSFLRNLTRRYGGAAGFSIFGSGDIFSARDIAAMLEQTGVAAVSVARGCIGNPWIFEQARAMLTDYVPEAPATSRERERAVSSDATDGGSADADEGRDNRPTDQDHSPQTRQPLPDSRGSLGQDRDGQTRQPLPDGRGSWRGVLDEAYLAAERGPTITQQRAVLLEHFELSAALHGEKKAGMMMRKFGIKFARHHPDAATVAKAFIAVKSLADWRAVLDAHYVAADASAMMVGA